MSNTRLMYYTYSVLHTMPNAHTYVSFELNVPTTLIELLQKTANKKKIVSEMKHAENIFNKLMRKHEQLEKCYVNNETINMQINSYAYINITIF